MTPSLRLLIRLLQHTLKRSGLRKDSSLPQKPLRMKKSLMRGLSSSKIIKRQTRSVNTLETSKKKNPMLNLRQIWLLETMIQTPEKLHFKWTAGPPRIQLIEICFKHQTLAAGRHPWKLSKHQKVKRKDFLWKNNLLRKNWPGKRKKNSLLRCRRTVHQITSSLRRCRTKLFLQMV